jgi:nicotinamidase-related amidase
MAKKTKQPAIRGETVSRRAVLQRISLAGLALPLMQFLTPSGGKVQGAEQKSGTITEERKMADQTPKKPVVIILDMASGYGWKPGSFGYDMVARVRQLKDAAYAAKVQVIHVNSMRRPTDNLPGQPAMMAGSDNLNVIPELQPVNKDIVIYKRFLSGFSHNDLDYTLRTMGCDTVLIAGASTDNTVLWTAGDAHQYRYRVVIVEDCTMVHREKEPPGAKECALRIIRNVLRGEVLPLHEVTAKYLKVT